tara:strand:+ start:241 stop:531 length:291 start_codon:yes stop_codon:yes gene_type:complete
MSDFKIIYENPNKPGAVIRMHPMASFLSTLPKEWTEEQRLIHLADKDLPTGTKYEIINKDDLPDSAFREAWEYVAGEKEKSSEDLSPEFLKNYKEA